MYKKCFKFSEDTQETLDSDNWDFTTFEMIVYEANRIIEELEEIQRLIIRNSPRISPLLQNAIDPGSKDQLNSLLSTIKDHHDITTRDYGYRNPDFIGIEHLDTQLLFR
ncbi:hypothetical protein D3C73_619700 [compost metagenome]